MLRWHSKGGASVDSIPTPAGILFITHAPAILYVVSKKCLITKYKVSHEPYTYPPNWKSASQKDVSFFVFFALDPLCQFIKPSQFLLPSVYSEKGLIAVMVLDNHNSTDSKGVKQAEPNLPVPVNNNSLLLRFRTQPLNATKGFSFMHISKFAGASLIT
jgi:hypothetical protein